VTFLNLLSRATVSLCPPTALVLPEAASSQVRSNFFLYGLAGAAVAAAGCGGESMALGATAGLLAAGGAAAWLVSRRSASASKIARLDPKPSEIVNLERPETWRRDQAALFWSDWGRYGEAVHLLKSVLLTHASAGSGVDSVRLPNFFMQKSDECQTMAIFNGALAYDREVGSHYGSDLDSRIETIRAGAAGRSKGGKYDITSVGWEMMAQGYPLNVIVETGRPVDFIKSLFSRNRFAVHSGSGHATTFLPIAEPTKHRFALEIDSLGGASLHKRVAVASLERFMDRYLRSRPGEFFNLYEWTPLPPSLPRPTIKRIS
jgi:hypothetical protein